MVKDVGPSGREAHLREPAPAVDGHDHYVGGLDGGTPAVVWPRTVAAPGGRNVEKVLRWVAGRHTTAWLIQHRNLVLDISAVMVATLEVFVDPPKSAQTYNYVLSAVAALALVWRRRHPLVVTLATFPGWLTGWAQIAAVIALYTLAKSRPPGWQLVLGTALVWIGRYVQWPPEKFFAFSVGRHILRLIEGGLISGLPVALGLLMTTRKDLSQRIAELAASRERERRLHAQAVRTEERARLAREMHDLVSHQVTLIAMQAGALQVATGEQDARRVAATIRQLSTRTLDELRQLVGLLRTTEDAAQPGLGDLRDLVRDCGVDVTLDIDLGWQPVPAAVSSAVYRTVQEALTNVGKHAPDAPTTVQITEDGDKLTVSVRNERPSKGARSVPSGGHGLIGLRERATLLGGSFEASATPEGGFAVTAAFPLPHTPAPIPASDRPQPPR